jgi:hypothetical protein
LHFILHDSWFNLSVRRRAVSCSDLLDDSHFASKNRISQHPASQEACWKRPCKRHYSQPTTDAILESESGSYAATEESQRPDEQRLKRIGNLSEWEAIKGWTLKDLGLPRGPPERDKNGH